MNLCKTMRLKDKPTKETWFPTHGGGIFHINLVGAKKRSDNIQQFKTLAVLAVAKALRINKTPKSTATDNSNLEDDSKHLNHKNIGIGADLDQENDTKERLDKAKFFLKKTLAQEDFNYLCKIFKPTKISSCARKKICPKKS